MAWDDDKHFFTARLELEVLQFLDSVAAALDEDNPHIPGVTQPSTRAPSRISALRELRDAALEGRLPRRVEAAARADPKKMAAYWRQLQAWHRVSEASFHRHKGKTVPIRPWSGRPCADVGQIPTKVVPAKPQARAATSQPRLLPSPDPSPVALPAVEPSPNRGRRRATRLSDEEVLAAYATHETQKKAAQALGIPRTTLASRLRRLGIQSERKVSTSKPSDEELLAAVAAHRTIGEAAIALSMPYSTLAGRLRKLRS